MKLISLNTWGGKFFDHFIQFVKEHKISTDIFCFQEIFSTTSSVKQFNSILRANLLEELNAILTDFRSFYFPTLEGFDVKANKVDFDLLYGQAIFIKKVLKVNKYKNYFIYQDKSFKTLKKNFSNLSTPLQYIQFTKDYKVFSIFNFHGTAHPAAKKDTPKRLEQSRKVKKIIDKTKGVKILVGDFNLSMYTKSIDIFEKDLLNLTRKYDIERTRSKLSPFFGKRNFQKFADYAFVSPDVNVLNFEVPDIKISDHLPMILEFS